MLASDARWFSLALILAVLTACSDDDSPPGAGLDGSTQGDGAVDAFQFKDRAPDRLLLPDALLDQTSKLDTGSYGDGGDPCLQWSNWLCQGQFPNYEAVCPPGANPKRIMRCIVDHTCTCEVVGVSPEKQCFYTPVPIGGQICSSFEQAFKKGCCRP